MGPVCPQRFAAADGETTRPLVDDIENQELRWLLVEDRDALTVYVNVSEDSGPRIRSTNRPLRVLRVMAANPQMAICLPNLPPSECPMKFATTLLLTLLMVHSLSAQEVTPEVIANIAEALPDAAPAPPKQPRTVLVYSKTLGFRHASIPTGAKAMQLLGERTRTFTAVHSEDPVMFDREHLDEFDAVLMLNTTGDCLAPRRGELSAEEAATLAQREENLHDFVAGGKGLAGIHSATDTFYNWKAYGDMIGGWFTGHPWHMLVPIKVDSPGHPLTTMFNADRGFEVTDEIYQFAPRKKSASYDGYQPYSRDKLRILLSLDQVKFDVSKGRRADEDYAVSWVREYEKGRVFYCSLGHRDEIYWNATVLKHYLAGIQFALGDLPADATPSGVAATQSP